MSNSKLEPVLLRAARMIKSGGRSYRDDDQEAWDMVCQLGKDDTQLATAYISAMELLVIRTRELTDMAADSGRAALVQAVAAENDRIEQVLAQALGGYPRYADDPENFPNAKPDDPSVCVGDEVPISLAMQAADEIVRLRTELDELKSIDRALSIETLARDKVRADADVVQLRFERDKLINLTIYSITGVGDSSSWGWRIGRKKGFSNTYIEALADMYLATGLEKEKV